MKKLKILVADDEEMLQELIIMILESEFSCEIIKASNGNEAISILKDDANFDLIISDFKMPGGNGDLVYLFNKTQKNIPFFLLSGGEIKDYKELNDFYTTNELNHFINKPFDARIFIDAVSKINLAAIGPSQELNITDNPFIKIKLSYYAEHTQSTAEVFIKLGENKYTKIVNANEGNVNGKDLLDHYQQKGIEYIYIEKEYLKIFLNDIYNKLHSQTIEEKKAETIFQISGFNFHVNSEGLNDLGISNTQIERVNKEIRDTISSLLNNPERKEQFKKLCESEGYTVTHSMLIIYIAGAICLKTNLGFNSTMSKITSAAFYHDFSLFDVGYDLYEKKLTEIEDKKIQKIVMEHPLNSANFLPGGEEILGDTRKIVLEHHELPNGNGYPKKLTASQISPLSCLFILAEQIALCLVRNDFSQDRLKDFISNSQTEFNQGNFSKFFAAAEEVF